MTVRMRSWPKVVLVGGGFISQSIGCRAWALNGPRPGLSVFTVSKATSGLLFEGSFPDGGVSQPSERT